MANLQASFQNGQLQIMGNIPLNVTDKQLELWLKESFQEVASRQVQDLTKEMLMELVAFDVKELCSLLTIKDPNTVRSYFSLPEKDPKYLPTVDGGSAKLKRVRGIELQKWLIRNGKEELLSKLQENAGKRLNR